jgi:hypothetical protein
VARPVIPNAQPVAIADTDWKVYAYYFMAGWWVFNGCMIFLGSAVMHSKFMAGGASMFAGIPIIGMVIGIVYALTGLGLVFRVEIARGIVNVICWITIVLAGISVAFSLLGGLIFGPGAILMALRSIFDIALAAFQIYLIGETDNFMR